MQYLTALLPRVTLKQTLILAGATAPLLLGGAGVLAILLFLMASGGTATPAPQQPIAFDHSVHAGDAAIPCEFCHRGVGTQAAATVPSVEQCMFCHSVVKTDSPQIQLLQAHWDTQTPVNWTRVHRVPDHVRFVHAPHIQAGVACETCHGDVASMEEVKQVRSLAMGDCQGCHRENSASLDCATCHK